MSFSIVYIINRFFYRIFDFLRDWYVGGFFAIGRFMIDLLERLDRTLALRITFQNIFQPLYQDHTAVGHLFGFFFRFWRLLAGAVAYFAVIIFSAAAYILWAAAPIYILYWGFGSN